MINKILSVLMMAVIGFIIYGEYLMLYTITVPFQMTMASILSFLITITLLIFSDVIVFAILLGTAIALWDE